MKTSETKKERRLGKREAERTKGKGECWEERR